MSNNLLNDGRPHTRKQLMKKLLVTGGAGFIGSHFVKHVLAAKPDWCIVNLDAVTYAGNPRNLIGLTKGQRERHTLVHGNVCDFRLLSSLFADDSFDAVIHLAAESHVDRSIHRPAPFVKTNINGTFQLLEAALKHWNDRGRPGFFRVVYISTDEVFGSLEEGRTADENAPFAPSSPYAASKAAACHLTAAYHKTFDLPTLITHCSNNFGPHQYPEKLIPLTIKNIIDRKPLPVYGDGQNVRDWMYVMDTCAAISAVLEKGRPGKAYNAGAGNALRNIDLVHMICDLLDHRLGSRPSSRRLIKYVKDRLGHDRRYALDTTRIRTEIGWRPQAVFEKAMADTIDWYASSSTG